MRFEEIMPALREGKKVRRRCWGDGAYLVEKEGSIVNQDGYSEYTLCEHIIRARDWEAVKEKKKYQRWINLYEDGSTGSMWPSREKALDHRRKDVGTVETRLIEWEVEE